MLTCTDCGTVLANWSRFNYCEGCLWVMTAPAPKPIPLEDTPIYAAMIRLVTTADRLAKDHPELPPLPPRKPLLRKGRKR